METGADTILGTFQRRGTGECWQCWQSFRHAVGRAAGAGSRL